MKNYIWIIVILIVQNLYGQSDYKFKKVSGDMLEQSVHPSEPDANAAFLYNGFDGEFEYFTSNGQFNLVYTVSQRIKVYKEDGKDDTNFSIPLYHSQSSREELLDLDAFTYSLENGKEEEVKLNKEDIYEEEQNEYWTHIKFAMPNVQEGSIVDIRYKIKSPFTFRVSEFYLQKDIPVEYATYELEVPQYYGYKPLVKGLFPLKVEEDGGRGTISYSTTTDASSGYDVQRVRNREKIDYTTKIYKFSAEAIPALHEEQYVHNMDNYKSSVSFELLYTDFPNSVIKNYSSTWNKVAEVLMDEKNFGDRLNSRSKEVKSIAALATADSKMAQAEQIYLHINQNYTWNGQRRLFASKENDFFKRKKGNSADINLLLISALNAAGIPAYPIVCKTRDRGYLNVSFPVIGDLNYVYAVAQIGEHFIYLDATTKGYPMGYLPLRAINLHGVLINGNQGEKIDISNPNESRTIEYVTLDYIDQGLKGRKMTKKGKMAGYSERAFINSLDKEEDYISALHEKNPNLIISSCEHQNLEVYNKDIVSKLDVDYSKYMQVIDDKIFIPLLLDQGWEENPFRAEERNFNVFFDQKLDKKSTLVINIPEGYKIESLPESLTITIPGKGLVFTCTTTAFTDKVTVSTSFNRNVSSVSSQAYSDMRMFYDELVKKTKEQIVLTKA